MIAITGSPIGYQHLAPSVSTGLTPPAGSKLAVIAISTASVTYRDDGPDPTTAAGGGVPLPAGTIMFYASNFKTIKFISVTGLVDVAYYG